MEKYIKEFEIRWADLDANRHVSNISFATYTIETRLELLAKYGIDQQFFEKNGVCPILLSEKFFYLREALPNEKIFVDVELVGHSEDGVFIKFGHSIFKGDGTQAVYAEVLTAWIDMKTRKLIHPGEKVMELIEVLPKAEKFAILKKEDTRDATVPYKKTITIS